MMEKSLGKALRKRVSMEGEIIEQLPRKKGVSILMNQTRLSIFQYLCKYPCSHSRGLARDLEIATPTAEWHLKKMVDAELVKEKKIGKSTVFYPSDLLEIEDVPLLALLNVERARAVFLQTQRKPGETQKELYKSLGIGHQAVRWYASKLEELGMICSVEDGKYKRYYSTNLIFDRASRRRAKYYREKILMRLKEDGLEPSIIRLTDRELVIQLKTGARKSILRIPSDPFIAVLSKP